ncbi:MAG: hypothetical protein HUJ26_10405 [Planctomycetaceae bacterium]|nr:hypothetical protein [Planctomycetaceae bacterium]
MFEWSRGGDEAAMFESLSAAQGQYVTKKTNSILKLERNKMKFNHALLFLVCISTLCHAQAYSQEKDIRDSTTGEQDSEVDLQTILTSWRERAEKTRAVRVSWNENVEIAPGGIMPAELAKERRFPPRFSKSGAPVNEISFHYDVQVLIDGDRLRYEKQTIAFDDNFDIHIRPYTSSFDGKSSRMLFSGGKSKPSGSIRKEQHNVDAISYVMSPLMFFVRPLNRIYAPFDEELLQFASLEDTPEAANALVLKQQEERITDLIWLENQSDDFLVSRWEQHVDRSHLPDFTGSVMVLAADIEYGAHPQLGRVPVSWAVMEFGRSPSEINKRYEATDVTFEVLEEVEQADFTLDFPQETEVYDHQKKQSRIVGESGNRLDDRWKMFLITNVVFIFVLVIAILMYRRHRQA